ncbi:conserved hypothetical protein [Trichinella spiralis]|uniref:hypothetical protein n=1 Tax=Trichinella spiralis TaxID=6334 RepID=UPI0001EFB6F3|nr:conserved hypothetical protein [Trichinella spiralis]
MRQRESNPTSSARQAIWLTTVLHAAQWAELHMRPVVKAARIEPYEFSTSSYMAYHRATCIRIIFDIFMGKRESNPMSSARQAVWLTTVLHAARRLISFNS